MPRSSHTTFCVLQTGSSIAALCNSSQLKVNLLEYFSFLAFPQMSDPFINPSLYTLPVLVSVSSSLTPESDGSLTDYRLITASVEATMTACNLNHTLGRRFVMGNLKLLVSGLIRNVEERRKNCKQGGFMVIYLFSCKCLHLICVTCAVSYAMTASACVWIVKSSAQFYSFHSPPNSHLAADSLPPYATATAATKAIS